MSEKSPYKMVGLTGHWQRLKPKPTKDAGPLPGATELKRLQVPGRRVRPRLQASAYTERWYVIYKKKHCRKQLTDIRYEHDLCAVIKGFIRQHGDVTILKINHHIAKGLRHGRQV